MVTRRSMLKTAGLAAAGMMIRPGIPKALSSGARPSNRPPAGKRTFVSEAVEARIADVKPSIADEELAWMFENCYPSTLDTTVRIADLGPSPDAFIITGDIDAMWLRDSSAQVWPYLPLARDDKRLKRLLAGLINRQARCVLIDPYANAFNAGPTGSEWAKDGTDMKPELHERKWEIDSLCYVIRLSHGYWKHTDDTEPFDSRWKSAMALILKTFREQQRKQGKGPYHFYRRTEVPFDTLPLGGYGNPTRVTGMIHSGFRPSDDACIYPYLIPSNMFAVKALRSLAEMADAGLCPPGFAGDCRALADEVDLGVRGFGSRRHQTYGDLWVYEADGYGNTLWMDDANVPSLLSLPYLGYCGVEDEMYQRTRAFVLSVDNPYYFKGKAAEGIGGPHVRYGVIWPLAIIMRGMTSTDDKEITLCLRQLRNTHAGTGFMHESFDMDNAAEFTRPWFAWANTLFGEFVLKVHAERKHILAKEFRGNPE
jgi:meiotically up-regulated gene 157 (Mug157) protein